MCSNCWDAFDPWLGPICPACGLPFASELALDSADLLCAGCRTEQPEFDRARSFGLYRDLLRAAILLLKFQRRERLGKRLGGLLANTWSELVNPYAPAPALVVPVPLHIGRRRERGYNQAELLAHGLAKSIANTGGEESLSVSPGALRKTRATPPQTGLSLAARRENVRGAFEVTSPESVRDRLVVIIDDVMTTGATLSACASVLKRAGALHVLALTLARATPQFPDVVPGRQSAAAIDEFAARQP